MLKFLSGIAIIAFMTWCGYLLAQKHRKRKLFFTELNDFNERFLNEILYYRRPMREFIDVYEYRGEFQTLLVVFFKDLENDEDNGSIRESLEACAFLSKDERGSVLDYFLMIGKGDSASQKNYFSAQKVALGKWKSDSVEACNRYGNLYVKIGFLFGLLILILII